MPIQFPCSTCAQPIEVDDPLAGKLAQCPYCKAIVNVPASTTLDAPPPIETARPVREPPPLPAVRPGWAEPPIGDLRKPIPSGAGGQRTAATYGRYALVATLLAIGLFIPSVIAASIFAVQQGLGSSPSTFPSLQQQQDMQRELVERYPWFQSASCGSQFFALAGLILSLIGLYHHRRGNWMIWSCLAVYGLGLCLMCGGTALMLVAGGVG